MFSMTSHAQWGIGLYGGYQKSKYSGILPDNLEYVYRPGYALGVTFDKLVAEDVYLSVRPSYLEGGTDIAILDGLSQYAEGTSEMDTLYLNNIRNRSIALPIICQIYVRKNFYCNAGLELAYNFDTDVLLNKGYIDFDDQLNPFNLSAIFGMGIPVPVGRTSFNLELSYSQGINTITPRAGIEEGNAPRIRSNRFRISVYFILFNTKER
jgi:hypothetical protein